MRLNPFTPLSLKFLSTPIITPVVLIIFNKPNETQQVFDAIRKAQPAKLYLICDGPRTNHPTDTQDITACQKIVSNINWPCEVIHDYSTINLGCGPRIDSGLSGVFEKEEQAIILEDDCLPSKSFFPFCQELLNRYKTHDEIKHISGTSFQWGRNNVPESYFFSKYPCPWGYATWRRSWNTMTNGIHDWPNHLTRNRILKNITTQKEKNFWIHTFNQMYSDNKNQPVWSDQGHQRTYSFWYNNGISITPNKNLVTYIGYTSTATHTQDIVRNAIIPKKEIYSITHPQKIEIHKKADQRTFNVCYYNQELNPIKQFLNFTKIQCGQLKRKLATFW